MLRVAAKQTATTRCRDQLVNIIRTEANMPLQQPSSSSGSGAGKKLLGLTLLTGAAAGGTYGYAQYDPEFNKKLQAQIHSIKDLFGAQTEQKFRQERKNWENELEDKLRRAASEHADNMERVVRAQKQAYEEENQKLIEVRAFIIIFVQTRAAICFLASTRKTAASLQYRGDAWSACRAKSSRGTQELGRRTRGEASTRRHRSRRQSRARCSCAKADV